MKAISRPSEVRCSGRYDALPRARAGGGYDDWFFRLTASGLVPVQRLKAREKLAVIVPVRSSRCEQELMPK